MTNVRKIISAIAALAVAGAFTSGIAAAAGGSMMMSKHMDRYGGPRYTGSPNLAATAAFVQAGGGAAHFSFQKALGSMAGDTLIDKEVAKLEGQYGKPEVMQWLKTWDFAVPSALHMAMNAGVTIPAPADLHGKALATALVKAGVGPKGMFWTGDMLDHTISHKLHDSTMDAIDQKYGEAADAQYHKITNQAMYDLAQALGATSVKLASYH